MKHYRKISSKIKKQIFIFYKQGVTISELGRRYNVDHTTINYHINEILKKISLKDLRIPSEVFSILNNNGIKTIAGLIKKSEEDLIKIRGIGDISIIEIKRVIGRIGFGLQDSSIKYQSMKYKEKSKGYQRIKRRRRSIASFPREYPISKRKTPTFKYFGKKGPEIGCIYVFKYMTFEGKDHKYKEDIIYKIGKTINIKDRINGHEHDFPLKPKLIIMGKVKDHHKSENELHKMFENKRLYPNTRKELFKLDIEKDIEKIKEYLNSPGVKYK